MIRKLLSLLHNKILIVSILILIQLFVFFGIVFKLSEYFVAIYFILIALSFCMSIYIINKNDNPTYKLTWVLLIMAVPVFGGLIYLLFGGQKVPKELRKRDSGKLSGNFLAEYRNHGGSGGRGSACTQAGQLFVEECNLSHLQSYGNNLLSSR